MKYLAFIFLFAVTAGSLRAQALPEYEYGPVASPGVNAGDVEVSWWGVQEMAYFVQVSTDLVTWTYAPTIYVGQDDVLIMGLNAGSDRLFVRTQAIYTGQDDPENVDHDADGIVSIYELTIIGTHPFLADTDGDGWDDGFEVGHGTSPVIGTGNHAPGGDLDGDGLSNLIEATVSMTSLTDSDTDDDGLGDTAEHLTHLTDPLLPDTDGDGLDDYAEVITYQTDPRGWDTDNDGMFDAWEVSRGLNATSATGANGATGDPDADGLTNIREYRANTYPQDADSDDDTLLDGAEHDVHTTSPLLVDTDEDGLTDAAEVNTYHTNPILADTDFDGLTDLLEVTVHLTNPLLADSDGDRIPDDWELLQNLNPLSASDGTGDSDADGLSNLQEYFWGLDPAVADAGNIALGEDEDNDGLSNGLEINTHNTNPAEADTDGDWMEDGWEVSKGLNPLSKADQWLDPDSDGLPNCGEFLFDKNPTTADTAGFAWNDDPDLDWLTTLQELTLHHTDPTQTDTDGDQLFDGWEVQTGFSAVQHNERDANARNNKTADADEDGLSNAAEAYLETHGNNADTDGDNISDGQEVSQGSDAIDPTSVNAPPQGSGSINITWGDPSGSHSEKYAVKLSPVAGGGSVRTLRNANYGEVENTTINVPKGTRFTLTLEHIGTDKKYKGTPKPDYDYQLEVTENGGSADSALVIEDPQEITGTHDESNYFFAKGKSATVTHYYLDSLTVVSTSSGTRRSRLGVGEIVLMEVKPSGSSISPDWNIGGSSTGQARFPSYPVGRTAQFQAGPLPSSPIVTATFSQKTLQKSFIVVAPNEIFMERTSQATSESPLGVLMQVDWYVRPTDVSFGNIQVLESTCEPVVSGYFAYEEGDNHTPGDAMNVTTSVTPQKGWKCQGFDLVSGGTNGPTYSDGSFVWNIPFLYKMVNYPGTTTYPFAGSGSSVQHIKSMTILNSGKAKLILTKNQASYFTTEP